MPTELVAALADLKLAPTEHAATSVAETGDFAGGVCQLASYLAPCRCPAENGHSELPTIKVQSNCGDALAEVKPVCNCERPLSLAFNERAVPHRQFVTKHQQDSHWGLFVRPGGEEVPVQAAPPFILGHVVQHDSFRRDLEGNLQVRV